MSWIFNSNKNVPYFIPLASSTNGIQNRTFNPLNFSSDDRWCSEQLEFSSQQWWSFTLPDYKVQISKYLVSTSEDHAPISWKLEALEFGEWKLLQTIPNSGLEINDEKHMI